MFSVLFFIGLISCGCQLERETAQKVFEQFLLFNNENPIEFNGYN